MEIIAHRGASYDAPENTLAAIDLAWHQQADAVEIDVRLTSDGEIVAIHDEETTRLAGVEGTVSGRTLEELKQLDVGSWKDEAFAGQRVPTLADLLNFVPHGKRLLVEVKVGDEIVEPLTSVMHNSGTPPEATAFIGFPFETLQKIKQTLPEWDTYWVNGFQQNLETDEWEPSIEKLIERALDAGFDGLDLGRAPIVNERLVQSVRQAGLEYYMWTINDPDEARMLQRAGANGITTDRPGWMRQQLEMV